MTPPLVAACLAGTKTETRRVILPQPKESWRHVAGLRFCTSDHLELGKCDGDVAVKCRYGATGDELWVKENHFRFGKWVKNGYTAPKHVNGEWKPRRQKWRFRVINDEVKFEDHPPQIVKLKKNDLGWRRRPSLFMARRFSRLTLVLESVTVERVQDITQLGAIAEGTSATGGTCEAGADVHRFQKVWDHINGKRFGGSIAWEANPFVFVLKFHVKK